MLERFALLHEHGSSHGTSRITRSTYTERHHVELAARVHRDGWPLFERELGQQLLHRTPGVFAGPATGPIQAFAAATLGAGVAVEPISIGAARARFPLLRFCEGDLVLLDHTAGVLAAAVIRMRLIAWLQYHGVELRPQQPVRTLLPEDGGIAVRTDHDVLRAQRAVVAIGAWTGDLVPALRTVLTVVRQQVGYFDLDAPAEAIAPGLCPVFVHCAEEPGGLCYGLPAFGRNGVKLARHRTSGPGDDPDAPAPPIDTHDLLALASQRLLAPVRGLLGSEHCLYTMAPRDELRVDPLDGDRRIAVVAACSGHAFKFAPEVGRRAAEMVLGA